MFKTKRLTDIGLKYRTDKAYFHLFTEFYNDYFEKFLGKNINILEIGISTGSSLLMLREFFPDAKIFAIDILETSVNLNLGEGIHKWKCSQDDFDQLNQIFKDTKFDIIIEDGSHMTSHQQTSLGYFFPYLNENGIYICEDLHTSYSKQYIDTQISTMEIFNNYKKTKTFECDLLTKTQIDYLNENIKSFELFERKDNALSCYNCKNYNIERKEKCYCCGIDLSANSKSITSVFVHC
jgi:23S rRNA U2552 (ribose-2'-O)-methylase RlmE/FtsJ